MANEIAQTILAQLGGKRFIVMTGTKDFVAGAATLSFRLPRGVKGLTHVSITLDASDTYTVRFRKWNARALEMVDVKTCEGIYCDMLQDLFTAETGLYTKL